MGAAPQATFPFARDHAHTEQAVRAAGISLTAMRNALYADVAPHFVGADGVIRAPTGHGRLAWVARADVARLAVVLLTEPGHEGQTYDARNLRPSPTWPSELPPSTQTPTRLADPLGDRPAAIRSPPTSP